MSKLIIPCKVVLFTCCFFLLFKHSYAQNKISVHASQVQIEALGPGGLMSINVDSRFLKNIYGFGYRFGLGATPLGVLGKSCNSGTILTIPAGLNYLFGKGKHLFETGGGGVLSMVSSTKRYCSNFNSGFFSDETQSYTYLLAGYRYQPVKKKGTTFRIFVSPLFQNDFPVKFWGGISVGHRV
jgi:hypothetical protein